MWTSHLIVGVYLFVACSSLFDFAEPSVVMEDKGGTRNKVAEYFPEIQGDLTRVRWAHAVNNKEELEKSLKDPHSMMLEADVLMGYVKSESSHPSHESESSHPSHETTTKVAIMAHPPDTSSDLGFDDFLETVVNYTSAEKARKGIKLDIKDIDALHHVVTALKDLNLKSPIHFPVWLNADVWKGPVNSQVNPLDAARFIKTIREAFKKSSFQPTLSLGWTTNYGQDSAAEGHKSENSEDKAKHVISSGQYSTEDVNTAIQSLKKHHVIGKKSGGSEITFPLRAGLAIHSEDQVEELLKEAGPRSTITLWSAKEDPKIDVAKLEQFVDKIGRKRVFLDLPFPVPFTTSVILTSPAPTTAPSIPTLPSIPHELSDKQSRRSRKSKDKELTVNDETGKLNDTTEKPDDDNGSTTPSNSGSSLSSISLLLLFCCAVFLRPAQ